MQNIPKVFNFPHDLQEIATGWVIQNLQKYRNSVLPASLLEIMEKRTIERLLEAIIEEPVEIIETKYGYTVEIVERV